MGLKMQIKEQREKTHSGKTAVTWSSSLSYSVSLRASLWAMLSPGSCLLPADRHQPTWSYWDHAGGGRHHTPSTATAPGLPLGLCCTSHLNLMLKVFKSHCQVHVKLPPHIRSVQRVPKRPTLSPHAEEIPRLGNDVAGLGGALVT